LYFLKFNFLILAKFRTPQVYCLTYSQIWQSLLGVQTVKEKEDKTGKKKKKKKKKMMMVMDRSKRQQKEKKERKKEEPTGRKRVHALRCIEEERRNRSFVPSLARVIAIACLPVRRPRIDLLSSSWIDRYIVEAEPESQFVESPVALA